MGKEYAEMSRDELAAERGRLQGELEDWEEMSLFHSVNSPAHATSTQRKSEAARVTRMRDTLAEIDALLAR